MRNRAPALLDLDDTLAGEDRTCLACGCTDGAACLGGCSWLVVDDAARVGICTACSADRVASQQILDLYLGHEGDPSC